MKKLLIIVLVALLACSYGCVEAAENNGEDGSNPKPPLDKAADAALIPDYVTANTAFGFGLFHAVAGEEYAENVFISPVSVGLALCMTLNGAQGKTRATMLKALSLDSLTLDQVNDCSRVLLAQLAAADESVELSIANSLWANMNINFLPAFIKTNHTYYHAKVTPLDFASAQAAPTINAWVSDRTNGKIAGIVDAPIDPLTILFLINAVYFKGPWSEPFDPDRTEEADFHLLSGTKEVQQMRLHSGFRYMENDELQAVRLPYGDERISMYVVLPREGFPFGEFCHGLDGDRWNEWMDALSYRDGLVALPRFKVEYEQQLNAALTALGMGIAFDGERADFRLMAQTMENIFISQVKHKTYLDVNEEGTEAAAATSVEMKLTSAPMEEDEPPPFELIVDRPFILAIRDDQTGALLFLGAIVEP